MTLQALIRSAATRCSTCHSHRKPPLPARSASRLLPHTAVTCCYLLLLAALQAQSSCLAYSRSRCQAEAPPGSDRVCTEPRWPFPTGISYFRIALYLAFESIDNELRVLLALLRGVQKLLLDVRPQLQHVGEAVLGEDHRLARRSRATSCATLALTLEQRPFANKVADLQRFDDKHELLVDNDVHLPPENEEHLGANGPFAHQPLALREGCTTAHRGQS